MLKSCNLQKTTHTKNEKIKKILREIIQNRVKYKAIYDDTIFFIFCFLTWTTPVVG